MYDDVTALLREVMVDSPFVPAPPPGIEVTFGGKMGAKYREVKQKRPSIVSKRPSILAKET